MSLQENTRDVLAFLNKHMYTSYMYSSISKVLVTLQLHVFLIILMPYLKDALAI
jgi:hypothetical protein